MSNSCKNQLVLCLALMFLAVQPARAQRLFEGSTKHLKDVERMYSKGLKWLASSQQANGSFNGGGRDHYGSQPGVVGLAVVAMLAHGDDPNFGPYSKNITNGVKFILTQQDEPDGVHWQFHVQPWLCHAGIGGGLRRGA